MEREDFKLQKSYFDDLLYWGWCILHMNLSSTYPVCLNIFQTPWLGLNNYCVFQSGFPKMQLQFLYFVVSAAQKDHPDSWFSKQKEPPPEDQTCGAEETGTGRLHPGRASSEVDTSLGASKTPLCCCSVTLCQMDILQIPKGGDTV